MKYKRIRELREDRDMTQTELAAAFNLTQRTYSRYETGDRTIPPDVLSDLADYYHTSVDYLMGRTDCLTPYPKAKNSVQHD